MSTPFERRFLAQLNKNMQEEISYSPSRRVEGMLQQDVSNVAPNRAAMVIDADLSQDDFKLISESIRNVLRKDNDFSETAFAVFVWKEGTLSQEKLQASNFIKARFMDRVFEQIDITSDTSGNWDNLMDLYGSIRKAPLKVIVTTDTKVSALEQSDFKGRNVIICYTTNKEAETIKKVRNMVCIPFKV